MGINDHPQPQRWSEAAAGPELRIPFRFEEALTERLRLRIMTDSDVDAVHAYQSRTDVCEYLLYEPRDHRTVSEKIAKWSQRTTLEREGESLELAVERRADGQVIGDLYFSLKTVEHSCAEIGWALHPDHQGLGYATEAAAELLRMSFATIGLHRVIAEVDPRNDASVALCRRLGMRQEAHFIEELWFKGAWADTVVYAMRETDWHDTTIAGAGTLPAHFTSEGPDRARKPLKPG